MKISTGLKEINTMVERFLTKEQSYNELLNSVKQKEKDCQNYKEKIDVLQGKLDLLSKEEKEPKVKTNEMEKKTEILRLRKVIEEIYQKKTNLQKVVNKVKVWSLKMPKRVSQATKSELFVTEITEPNINHEDVIDNLRRVRNDVKNALQLIYINKDRVPEILQAVKRETLPIIISKIKEKQKDESEDDIELKDLIGIDENHIIEDTPKKSSKGSARSQGK